MFKRQFIQIDRTQIETLKLDIEGLQQIESLCFPLHRNPDVFESMAPEDIANSFLCIERLIHQTLESMNRRIEFIEKTGKKVEVINEKA